MWAVVREEGPAGFPYSLQKTSEALHSTHTPTPNTLTLYPHLSPEGLSHLPEHRWRMPGPRAHWVWVSGRGAFKPVIRSP
eukprot:7184124-Prymnesium_polylepis.1